MSQAHYSSFFNFNPLPSWVYNLKTFQIYEVNQAAIVHYEYSREEFLKLTSKEFRTENEIPEVVPVNIDVKSQEGNFYIGTFTHQKKNGGLTRMKVSGHKEDYLGNECMMVVCQDVTREEEQVSLLKESEERLKAATSIAKLGYWRLEIDTDKLSWTDEVYRIWGRQKEDFNLNLENFTQTIHRDDLEAFDEAQIAAVSGEKEHDFVHRIILPDNSIRWVHELGRLVKDEKGKPIVFEGTVQDVTARKEEEQRLKLLESVITNTNDAILITEAEQISEPGPKIVYVNEAFTKMTGYTAEEVVGKNPRMLQGPKSDRGELARLGKALENHESCEITTINYKKNGDEFWNNFTVSPVADEKGCYTHFISIERDVTEQKNKELERELISKLSLNFNIENDLNSAANELCRTVSEFGEFDFVELWLPNLTNTQIHLIAHKSTTSNAELFYEWSKEIKFFHLSEGLPGIVWHKKSSVLWSEISKNEDFVRKEAAEKAGVKTALGIPLFFNEKVVGVLVIGTQLEINFLKKYVKIFEQLEQFLGSEINRKKLENDLQHLYDAIPDIICITDLQGKFLKINKAGCDLIGYSEDEILHNTFERFVHPGDKDISHDDLINLNKGAKTFGFENRYITHSGEIIWLSWTSNSNLQEGLIYATARNITAEKKLRQLNKQATELAKIGSWEVNFAKNEIIWSEMLHKLHETDSGTFFPDLEDSINFYREDFRSLVKEMVEKSIDTGVPFDFEAVLVTAKKNERWVRAIGNAEFIDGKSQRIYGSLQDIHQLKDTEIRLKSLADNLPGVVFQYLIYPDGKDCLKYVTKGSQEVWGFSAEEVLQNNQLVWDRIAAGGDIEKVQKTIADSIDLKTHWTARWKYVMPEGEIRTHVAYGSPTFLAEGTVLFNSVILDVTNQAKNEDLLEKYTLELERSNEELEQFAFIASHDLQEPLRMISSFMDLLQRKYGDLLDEKGHQYIHFATDGAKRMKQIILDLLDYSRANRPSEGKEKVDMNEVLSEFKQLRRKLILEKNASIKSNNLPTLNTHRAAVTQILHCLLDNALNYIKDNTSPMVEINVVENEKVWEFSIKDNGIGIDPQFYEKIFVIFQRLHNKDQYSGTGIGLSIAKRHVEFLGGQIWLESAPGDGSIFYFTIPKIK